jgi:hypothetical protein
MRYFPELQLIVKGMVAALRSVMCALFLMMMVLYVFAIIFVGEYHVGNKPEDDWGPAEDLFGRGIFRAIKYLLIMGTILDDLTACTNAIRYSAGNGHNATTMLLVFWVCVIICGFTLFSMLLGLLCEVVEATKDGEKKKAQTKELHITMMEFFRELDADGNGTVTRQEFLSMRNHPDIGVTLQKLNIESEDFDKYAAILFTPEHEGGPIPVLEYQNCVKTVMMLRPGHDVNTCDFQVFKRSMEENNKDIMRGIEELESMLLDMGALEPESDEENQVHGFDEEGENSNPPLGAPRQMPTLAKLAKFGVPAAPAIASKWSEKDVGSPQSPTLQQQRQPVGVDAKVQQLVAKRRTQNDALRESMYGEQLGNQEYYGFQRSVCDDRYDGNPPLRNAAYSDNEEPPFSPNQMLTM